MGDFNGDGKQDLAVANFSFSGVSILMGDGVGNFSAPTTFNVGTHPYSVAVGDFNGDGKQDLAVVNRESNNVSILLGDGVGNFGAATNFEVAGAPYSVAVGDFNGDGKQDLAVATYSSSSVSTLLGDGAGNFGAASNFGPGFGTSVAVGDFNGDGKQDLVVANFGIPNISILLGNGTGNFSAPTNFDAGPGPYSVAVGDFNGDGKQDLAVTNQNTGTVSVLLGNGVGSFSDATNFGTGIGASSVAIGDFNADGNQDLAVANYGTHTVSILSGDGAGNFGAATNFEVGSQPYSVAVGDFNGDGQQDLAVADISSGGMFIFLRDCSISGTVLYCSNPVPGPVPNVTVTLTGSTSASTLSDGNGNYTVSSLPPSGNYTVTPTKAARVPGSAGISGVDAIATQRHFLNLGTPLTGCRLQAADVTGTNGVDGVDAIAIQRFFLGFTSGIANTGKYKFTPLNRSYVNFVSNQIGQNYDTLVFGDVASSFVERVDGPPPDSADDGTSADKVPAAVSTVALPAVTVDASVTGFIVPVTTTRTNARDKLVGFQGDLSFDERVVTFPSEPVQKAGLTGGNWNVSANVLPGTGPIRTLRVSAYSNDFTTLSGTGTLFELRMLGVSTAAQSTPLLWAAPPDNFIFIDADLKTQKPGNAAPGSVTSSGKRK